MASLTHEPPKNERFFVPAIILVALIFLIVFGLPLIGRATPKENQGSLAVRMACYSQNCAVQFEACLNNSAAEFSACQNRHQSDCFNAQQNADALCEQEFRQCIQNCKTAS